MKSSSKISNRSTQSPSLCFWTASAVLAFLVLVGLPIPSSATNATQTLTVAADNFLKKDSRNGNRGDYTLLKTDEDNKSHILLRFDQSQIAAALNGRTLISASLQLYIVQNWGGFTTSGKEVDVYRMTGNDGDWTEMGSTWNCPIDTNTSNSTADCAVQWDGGTKVSTATDHHQWYDTTVGWQSFNVTSDVNLFMSNPNYGWLVRKLYSFETGSVDIASREYSQQNKAPKLVLTIADTPCVITGTPSPVPNQYGWSNTNVTVTFSCSDLDGVASCTSPQTISTTGMTAVAGQCIDSFGNSVGDSSVIINVDKIAPSLQITSPDNNDVIPSSQVSVAGSASDETSGIQEVTCNGLAGQFAGGVFECGLLLTQGSNTISVNVSDPAGNSSSDSIMVESQPTICNHGEVATLSPSNIALASPTTVTASGDDLDLVARVTLDGSDIDFTVQDSQTLTFDVQFETDANHQVLFFVGCSSDPFHSETLTSGTPGTELSALIVRRVGSGGALSPAKPFVVFDSSLGLLPNDEILDESSDLVIQWSISGTPTIDPGHPSFTMGPYLTYVERPFDFIEIPAAPDGTKINYIRVNIGEPYNGTLPDGSNLPNDRYEINLDAVVLKHVPHIAGLMGQPCEFNYEDASELAAGTGTAGPKLAVMLDQGSLHDTTPEETELLNNQCLTGVNCSTPFTFEFDSSQTDDKGYRYSYYQQYLDLVPVDDGYVGLKVDTISGQTVVTDNTRVDAVVSLAPGFGEVQAIQFAQTHLAQSDAFVDQPLGSLRIHPKLDGTYALSYMVASSDPSTSLSGSTYEAVDATTGAEIESFIDPEVFPEELQGSGSVPLDCKDDKSAETQDGGDLHRIGKVLNYNTTASRFFGFSEYYPVTMNGFDMEQYTRDVSPFVNLQRIWVLGSSNSWTGNGCTKPFKETMPFKTATGCDSSTCWDLSRFNDDYFNHLEDMVQYASNQGLIVELTLFDGVSLSTPASYKKTPWFPDHNINWPACEDVAPGSLNCMPRGTLAEPAKGFPEFYNTGLRAIQLAYVDRVLQAIAGRDNVFIEIMNEARIANVDRTIFKTWNEQIAQHVHDGGFLASGNVLGSLPGQNPNLYECDIYMHKELAKEIDIVTLHFPQWSTSNVADVPAAINQWNGRFYKPVIIDDDGAKTTFRINQNVINWAKKVRDYSPLGQAHYNSKGEIVRKTDCLNCDLLMGDGEYNPPNSIDAFEDLLKAPGGVVRDSCPDGAGGPTLNSPATGAWTGRTPTLKWIKVDGATSYIVEVLKPDGAPAYPAATITATTAQIQFATVPSGKLFGNVSYNWHVQSCVAATCSGWSAEWNFLVKLKVFVDLGTTNKPQDGLYPNDPEPGDGQTFAPDKTTIHNVCTDKDVDLKENWGNDSQHGANDRWFYFKVENKFIENGKDGANQDQKSVQITATYWDHLPAGWETNTMCLWYDSVSLGGAKQHPSCVTVGNTGCMKTATWTIANDAYFGGRLAGSADFRIKTGNNTPPVTRRYINVVSVTKQ